jgi:hypothetical protein
MAHPKRTPSRPYQSVLRNREKRIRSPGRTLRAALACAAALAVFGCTKGTPRGVTTIVSDSLLSQSALEELRLVRLRDRHGVVHEAWLRFVPSTLSGWKSYQPVIVMGGIGTGRRAARVVPCPPGFAILAVDYPYDGPRAPGRGEVLRYLPDIHRAAHQAPGGIGAAIDYTRARGDMSKRGAVVIGASFGVPFVVRGLADLPRERDANGRDRGAAGVRAVALLFGGADLPAMVRYRMRDAKAWEREVAATGVQLLFADLEPGRYVGRIAPRPLLLINGSRDEFVSARAAERLWQQAGEPKHRIVIDSRHLQPDAEGLLRDLVGRTMEWLRGAEAR